METSVYQNAAVIFILLTIVIFCFVIYGLRCALKKATWSEKQKNTVFYLSIMGLLGWLSLLAVLANLKFFSDFNSMPPRFVLAIAPPWLVIGLLATLKRFRYLLHLVPATWLVYLQSFRVVVEIVLWMVFVAGVAPVQMTFEGRNLDILVGLTAPFAAYFWFRKNLKVRWGILWNIFGLGLLLNIVITSVLSAPTPLRVFWNEPANTFVTTMPFIWLPGFVVPVALALHVFSLIQLFNQPKAINRPVELDSLQKVAQ